MYQEQLQKILEQASTRGYAKEFKKYPDLINDLRNKFGKDLSLTELFFAGLNNLSNSEIRCPIGKKRSFAGIVKGYRKFCGTGQACACRRDAQSDAISNWHSSLDDRDKTAISKKMQATSLQKYGVEFPMQSTTVKKQFDKYGGIGYQRKDIRDKSKKTCLERYGTSTPFANKEIQQKSKETTVQRYGGLMTQARDTLKEMYPNGNPFNLPEIQAAAAQTRKEKYGTPHFKQTHISPNSLELLNDREKFVQFAQGKTLGIIAFELGINATTAANYANKYQCRDVIISAHKSIWEYHISQLLEKHNIRYLQNTKQIIPPLEIDFFLPDYNAGIEVGSLFWHSELHGGRDKNYHYNKWQAAREQSVSLYQYWDDELSANFDIIEKKILHITGGLPTIGARKTVVKLLDNSKIRRDFLNTNHIQGTVNDRTYSYAAYYQNQMVGLLDLKQRKHGLEIVRFATQNNFVWAGLFSKMLKYCLQDQNYSGKIYSFSDNRHSNGNLYQQAGFEIEKILSAGYWYTKDYHQRYHRQNFMKSKIQHQFDIDISDQTEWQAMQSLGYDRIWDAGKIKWTITV